MKGMPAAASPRSSGLELLRIIAMLMVFAHHFVLYNALSVWAMPFSLSRLVITVGMLDMGKVGVLVFFTITAWFLCESRGGLQRGLRRIWLMERELLFYSVGIYLIFRFGGLGALSDGDGWKAIFPLARARWWYPTSYAAFILFEPIVRRGLRALGQREHLGFAVAVGFAWGLLQGLIRETSFTAEPVVVFLAIYVVVCYVRWYCGNLPVKVALMMVVVGFVILVVQACYGGMVAPGDSAKSSWLATGLKLPPVLMAVGLVSVFARLDFKSPVVNSIARPTFAAYLISEYPPVRALLWKGVFAFGSWAAGLLLVPASVGCVIAAFGLCIVADIPRRLLFRHTVDRNPGALFDRIWDRVAARLGGTV